jgi:hypothetical protein
MLEPVPRSAPPHELEYHFQAAPVPREPPVTFSVVLSPSQRVVFNASTEGVLERLLIVNTNVAHLALLQPLSVVRYM